MSEEAGGRADVVDGIIARWAVELPEAAGMPLELYKRAARLTSILDRAVYAQVERLGLTRAEFDILATMRRADAPHRLTPSELSQGLLLSSGGTSNVLRRLTQAGLVERHGNAGDRRSSWVQLTDLGVEKAELAVRLAARATAQALRDVAPEPGTRPPMPCATYCSRWTMWTMPRWTRHTSRRRRGRRTRVATAPSRRHPRPRSPAPARSRGSSSSPGLPRPQVAGFLGRRWLGYGGDRGADSFPTPSCSRCAYWNRCSSAPRRVRARHCSRGPAHRGPGRAPAHGPGVAGALGVSAQPAHSPVPEPLRTASREPSSVPER